MDSSNSRKRGRPATGRAKKGVVFMRVPEGKEEEIRVLVRKHLAGAAHKGEMQMVGVIEDAAALEIKRLMAENSILRARILKYEESSQWGA